MPQATPEDPTTLPRQTPDRKALAMVGNHVRVRLAQDPGIYKVPVDRAEIFAIADFLDARE